MTLDVTRRYLLVVPLVPSAPAIPDFSTIAPSQVQTCAIDFGTFLPIGVTLTGTPTVTVTVHSGTDVAPASRVVAGPVVGTASLSVNGTGVTNATVLFQLGGCLADVVYLIEVHCTRSDGDVAEAWTHISCVRPS